MNALTLELDDDEPIKGAFPSNGSIEVSQLVRNENYSLEKYKKGEKWKMDGWVRLSLVETK